jgi:hypothetical protein
MSHCSREESQAITHENWDYPDWGPSTYFTTIICIHAHLYPDDRPLRIQICERLHHHTADELFLHSILWTARRSICYASCARGNPHARIWECRVRFSGYVWTEAVGDIVLDPYFFLHYRLTAQRYCDFLQTLLPGLPEDVPLAVRHRLWFQRDEAPAHCGEDVWQWLNDTYQGRWIRR